MRQFYTFVINVVFGGILSYWLLTHFFNWYQLELPLRFIFFVLALIFLSGLLILLGRKININKGVIVNNYTLILYSCVLALLSVTLIWVKGFNQVMPFAPNHILTIKWENELDGLPLQIEEIRLSYGQTIYIANVRVGGPFSTEYGTYMLHGPENIMVFDASIKDGLEIKISQVNDKIIRMYWDGLPVQMNCLEGQCWLNIPDYKWANSIWYKKLFFATGAIVDTIVEIIALFFLFFLLISGLSGSDKKLYKLVFWVILLIYFLVMIGRAWICDDAYITFRTVDNFINGYGLTWNIAERVQSYTHPLWMLLLSFFYFITHEIYFTSLFVSVILSFTAVFVLYKYLAFSNAAGIIPVLILTLSNAFVDYSTSGLENPLSYFLMAMFLLFYFSHNGKYKVLFLSLIASFSLLNRMDTGLFYVFPILYELKKNFSLKHLSWIVIGQIPFMVWEIFSIIYYGFPFPNTAYAKLSAGIARDLYYQWGGNYFKFTYNYDILTFIGIISGLISIVLIRDWNHRFMAFGIPLYMFYIGYIGGDFMGGRYFALPLFCAMALLSRIKISTVKPLFASVLLLVITWFAMQACYVTPITQNIYDINPAKFNEGVADERLYYSKGTGLAYLKDRFIEKLMLNDIEHFKWPDFIWRFEGERMKMLAEQSEQTVFVSGVIGFKGYFAGPNVYIIDCFTLSDPLLARLPAIQNTELRVGHLVRTIPNGYVESIEHNSNQFSDPNLALFYDKLTLITQEKNLFLPERLLAIWNMNLKKYDYLINNEYYKYQPRVEKLLPPKYWEAIYY